jgi:hypothetical protein
MVINVIHMTATQATGLHRVSVSHRWEDGRDLRRVLAEGERSRLESLSLNEEDEDRWKEDMSALNRHTEERLDSRIPYEMYSPMVAIEVAAATVPPSRQSHFLP